MPCVNNVDNSNHNLTPALFDDFVDGTAASLSSALNLIAPLKKKVMNGRRLAPWYNSQLRCLKQAARKLERIWHSTNSEEAHIAWKDSLTTYKKALRSIRTAYYSSLIEENKNNPRFLFSSVASLTKSHSSVEPSIPLALSSNDFISFFTNKIVGIRENIQGILPPAVKDGSTLTLETSGRPNQHLESFSPVDLSELSSTITASKPSTCLLDPIPTSEHLHTEPDKLIFINRICASVLVRLLRCFKSKET